VTGDLSQYAKFPKSKVPTMLEQLDAKFDDWKMDFIGSDGSVEFYEIFVPRSTKKMEPLFSMEN
jgi:hypothetical protein